MKKNMQENFEKLWDRVIDSLEKTDLEKIRYTLRSMEGGTLTSGVGGSSVVSEFAAKVLNEKNQIPTRNLEPRDFSYQHLYGYQNVLACSYSGNNYGVKLAFLNDLKHYLLSSRENEEEGIINLTYQNEDKEKSFVSLAATIIPCSVLLDYYLDGKVDSAIFTPRENYHPSKGEIYEIFTGCDTSTSAKFLESTMVEAGIGLPIVHDKYSFCHGRSTTCLKPGHTAIYFDTKTEFDRVLLEEIPAYFDEVIVIPTERGIVGDYLAMIDAMYLAKALAEVQGKDLSGVDYNPVTKKIYTYHGEV